MVEKVEAATISLWGEPVGAVAWLNDRGYGVFEFYPDFLKKGLDISPLHMGLDAARRGDGIFSFPGLNRETFMGLPGLLADALPDKFGNSIIDAWLMRSGRDIAIVLDVSRSMLAEDLKPNRLERARLAISDLVDQLEGDRVALLAFAGSTAVKCPLTQDYGFFRAMLDDVGVETVGRGGTLIGDALRKVMGEVFSDNLKRYKDIILITDGEDQDSFPIEAAKEIGDRGVRLIAIGLGDENEGQRIPTTNEKGERTFLRYQGKEIWSRLDADTLRKMVDATPGGRYINVATGTFDLGSIYQNLVASAEKKELESQTVRRYEEKFQIFLGVALLLLLVELLISERRNGELRK